MQLGDQQASSNVEDRRGMGVGGGLGVGGVVVAVIAYFLGFDPGTAINVAQQVTTHRQDSRPAPRGADSGAARVAPHWVKSGPPTGATLGEE